MVYSTAAIRQNNYHFDDSLLKHIMDKCLTGFYKSDNNHFTTILLKK